MVIRILVSLVLTISFSSGFTQKRTQPLTEVSPESVNFSGERLNRIDTLMQTWTSKNWTNGSAAMIVKDGKIVYYKAFGYEDEAKKTASKKDLIYRIASQTKAITSVAAMILYEQGKLMLDDPISMYIPEFKNPVVLDKLNAGDTTFTTVPAKREITIRDLLTHTSGIGYPSIGSKEANAIYAKYNIPSGIAVQRGFVLSDAMKKLAHLPLMHQPGERWTYGLNLDVLGYIIEVISGISLEVFFNSYIFKPLGMKDTYFYIPGNKQDRLKSMAVEDAAGLHVMPAVYNGGMQKDYPNTQGTYFSGGAGLSSTMYDYAIFLQMLLNGGEYNGARILSPSSVHLMTINQIGNLFQGNNKFGLGFSITGAQEAARFPAQEGTFGWGGIFSTTYWVDPKEKIVAQIYSQVWGRKHNDLDKRFMVLVYQAMSDYTRDR